MYLDSQMDAWLDGVDTPKERDSIRSGNTDIIARETKNEIRRI